jgi:hypothetical protein
LYRGVHCANSQYPYNVRWLDCPQHLFPTPLKAIARGFIILLYICICSLSTIFPHLHLLHSSSPSHKCPSHTVLILHWLLIPKSMFKEVSRCVPALNILHFGQFNSLCYSPLLFPPTPQLFNSFQYILLYPLPVQI